LPAPRLRPGGRYVVTGGLGRLGLLLAGYLARRYQASLVLVGRGPALHRSEWERVAANPAAPMSTAARGLLSIEAAGGRVLLVQADVGDPVALAAALAEGERVFGGSPHGVVHAAAVTHETAFSLLLDTNPEQTTHQVRAKLAGLRALRSTLADEQPDFVVALSSLSAVLGGLGLSGYAAASAAVDAEVRLAARERPGVWSTVDMDGWEDPDEGHGSVYRAVRGPSLIGTAEADLVFDHLFRLLDVEQTYLSVTDLPPRISGTAPELVQYPRDVASPRADAGTLAASSTRHPRPQLRTRYRAPADELEEALVRVWQDLLGVEPIGAEDDFFELGGHSLLAMQLVAQLRSDYDFEIPLRAVFRAPTVAQLSAELTALLGSERAPT
jgi:phthiocerol/phenolphthiocerol synthesis type-I polyketide synthase E